MVTTIKISEMTDGGDFALDQVAPVLQSGANRKVTVQLQFAATGDTATRPASPATPTIRYNTDFEQFEYWDGLAWTQLSSSGSVAALIARLAAHTAGDGASMIGLENQGAVSGKTVQDMSEADFIVKTTTSSLLNGFALSSLSTGFMSVTTGTGALVSRSITGSANQIDVANGSGLSANPQISISANPQFSGTSNARLPFGSTAQRPVTPLDGMIRYNTTDNVLEYYDSNLADWQQVAPTTGVVASVSGTLNRITSTGGLNPIIDISGSYVGQTSLITLGTVTTGTWQSTIISPTYGGTGINNGSSTITIGGSVAFSGAHTFIGVLTGDTNVTFPTSGTLSTTTGTVTSVSGTAARITSTGGNTPIIDISASYVGQASITTLGTIGTGVWQGTVIGSTYGGTGVNNGSSAFTIGGNFSMVGAHTFAGTLTGDTAVTFPTSGTLLTSASAVSSITGTANQITASASVGAVTLSIASNPVLPGTGGVTLPQGTTAQEAGAAGTMRFNTQTTVFEGTLDGIAWTPFSTAAGTVVSVSGTSNRITSTGGTTPVIDISASYVGQSSITTLGTISSGTWNGSVISPTYGGTGVNNGTSTITIGGNTAFSGAFTFTGTLTGNTAVTFPTSGTLSTTTGTVTAVTGTTNRITSSGGNTPAIDISASYVGQASITTLGTIGTGVWNGTVITGTYGGTGVNNGASTITIGGNVTFSGAHTFTGTITADTSVTFPTSGTLLTSASAITSVVIQVFTADGTYTPTSGMKYCIVEAVGGGAGGGGCATTSAVQVAGAGGGGGGSYARSVLSAATIGASKAVDIGAFGAGGTAGANNGSNGSDTTLGTTLVVGKGGSGGTGAAATGSAAGNAGGAGGVAGTGTVTVVGGLGQGGIGIFQATAYNAQGGAGGNSAFGQGGAFVTRIALSGSNNGGSTALGFGSGGGGASNTISCAATAGGDGAPGYMIITEFI